MGLLRNLQARVKQTVSDKLKGALARHDGLLLPVLGKVMAQPALSERVFGEAEVFLIKSALFMRGVRLHDSALQDVGTRWKEDLGQRHFDPDGEHSARLAKPHALCLPHGLSMPIYVNPQSSFSLRREGGTLLLCVDELPLLTVEYQRRPAYYGLTTSTGLPMQQVGVHRLERQVLVEYNATCRFFAQKQACLFCGIPGEPLLKPRHNKYFAASPVEVAEVVEAAYRNGEATEMQVTGGVLAGQAELPYLLEVGRAMQQRLGVDTVPGSQAVLAPPQDRADIEALRQAGWACVSFNLEIWDEKLWPGMVPGKHALLPREKWLEALLCAVELFGKGNVSSVLVAGIEPRRSLLAGAKWLAEHGIYGVPIPWSPAPGSAFEGHQTPTADWHIKNTVAILGYWREHGLPYERHSSGSLHYADLGRMRQHLEEDLQRNPGLDVHSDLRHTLAVEGRLPQG